MALVLILTLIILGIIVCEHRNLYVAVASLLIQNILLILLFYGSVSIFTVIFSTISLVIVIPLIIFLTISKTKSYSEEPFIDGLTSISILIFLISISTAYAILNSLSLKMLFSLSLLIIGVYMMIVKADLIKLGLGLSLVNNATHILTMGVEIPILADVSLTIVKIFTISLIMGLAVGLYNKTGSLDIRKLTLLRW